MWAAKHCLMQFSSTQNRLFVFCCFLHVLNGTSFRPNKWESSSLGPDLMHVSTKLEKVRDHLTDVLLYASRIMGVTRLY